MTRILLAGAAVCALAFGTANAAPASRDAGPAFAGSHAGVQATDLSSARRKAKRMRARRTSAAPAISSGASPAGTGGGAGGQGGSGAASTTQSGSMRGNPAAPTR